MAKKLVYILFVILSLRGYTQSKPPNLPYLDDEPFRFGIALGYSQLYSNMVGKQNLPYLDSIMSYKANEGMGFQIGIITDLRLHRFVNLKFIPTVCFSERDFEYSVKHGMQLIKNKKNMEVIYIEVPLELNIKSKRWYNMRPYIITGIKYSYDAGSIKRKKLSEDEYLFKIEPNELFYTLGAGCDFYLPFFKLGVELKTSFGLNDILEHSYNTVYSDCLDKIKSQIFYINFNFSI